MQSVTTRHHSNIFFIEADVARLRGFHVSGTFGLKKKGDTGPVIQVGMDSRRKCRLRVPGCEAVRECPLLFSGPLASLARTLCKSNGRDQKRVESEAMCIHFSLRYDLRWK